MEIVITTIFPPTNGTKRIAQQLETDGGSLWVMGDRSGPKDYALPHARFFDIEAQKRLPFQLASLLPERHYTRKNLGYLLAIQSGAPFVVETDDDNIPLAEFWNQRQETLTCERVKATGWVNVYKAFSSAHIWPRGFPLEELARQTFKIDAEPTEMECLIQQGLANQNPDVDAVYRLLLPLPIDFNERMPLALDPGCWCPFNSQNTTFFKPAFPLLYLPTFCSFRMTDIWRSFVAQRCLWAMESRLVFTSATVYQERNEHNLLKDFEQEVPGYLKNNRIREVLEKTELQSGRGWQIVGANLLACYESLIKDGILPETELPLVDAWNRDLSAFA